MGIHKKKKKKKVGIACDPWKTETFKRHLDANGFKNYKVIPGDEVTAITVRTSRFKALEAVVAAAQLECKNLGGDSN